MRGIYKSATDYPNVLKVFFQSIFPLKELINEISRNSSALITLTEANLKVSVASTRLGWLWWIVNPLVMMGIYYFFVGVILGRGGENYHLFVLTGIIAWQCFSLSLNGATKVIVGNTQLIKQVALPIPMLLLVPVLVQLIFAAIGFAIVLLWNVHAVGMQTLLIIPLMLLTGMVSYGLGLFVSILNVYLGDTDQILNYVLRMGFFLTPILYPAEYVVQNDKIPELVKVVYQMNPMAIIVPAFRSVLLDGKFFPASNILILTVCTVVLIQLGLTCVRKQSSQIVRML
jgi:lipopolysaccharide transport system permease protein